jgi:hypothetical protein
MIKECYGCGFTTIADGPGICALAKIKVQRKMEQQASLMIKNFKIALQPLAPNHC